MEYQELKRKLAEFKQEHLLQFWDELTDAEKQNLVKDINGIDLEQVTRYYQIAIELSGKVDKVDDLIQPIRDELYGSWDGTDADTRNTYWEQGLREISQGHVGVLLMAGGQGTRLGTTHPKGMYDIGLLSHKSLFQVQAERILKLQSLSKQLTGKQGMIRWYIMTSGPTIYETKQFFECNGYFGLCETNIIFFEQGLLPCFDFNGRILLDKKDTIAQAPDGNGGIYRALKDNQILNDMKINQVKYLHVHGVDNILVKNADPTFIGYCVLNNSDCAAKVVQKVNPTEAVGVICQMENKIQVVEYNEITTKTAELRAPDGTLQFKAGNICNHFFTREFVERIAQQDMKLHVAKKKIPFVDEFGVRQVPKVNTGIKIEKFVFDVFEFSERFRVWEVPREDEFSAFKNADSAGVDCPSTARHDLFTLHKKYLVKAGAKCEGDEFEIAPMVSYNGEGLESYAGKVLTSPTLLE